MSKALGQVPVLYIHTYYTYLTAMRYYPLYTVPVAIFGHPTLVIHDTLTNYLWMVYK